MEEEEVQEEEEEGGNIDGQKMEQEKASGKRKLEKGEEVKSGMKVGKKGKKEDSKQAGQETPGSPGSDSSAGQCTQKALRSWEEEDERSGKAETELFSGARSPRSQGGGSSSSSSSSTPLCRD
ncbi:UNVERIFIED_CONTAM: hypothetical protein FKN15_017948 [Acipenser sinensis]